MRLNGRLLNLRLLKLNVRLSMKLTVWPNMRLNERLRNGRLNRRLNVGSNGWLRRRLGC